MRKHVILLLAACGTLACGMTPAQAQINPISFPRLVPQLAAQKPPATSPRVQSGDDYHRLLEILIELAWLGDPITFSHLLEAKVEAGSLRVRGKVPDDAVREQALKLARLQCPMKVVDETKPGPAIERSTRVNPLVLQQAAQSALSELRPYTGDGVHIRCETDGKVIVEGHVKSFAVKLAISKKLQRMHGCACVANHLEVCLTPPAVAPARRPAVHSDPVPLVCIRKKPQSRFRTLLCLPGKSSRVPAGGPALASAAPPAPDSNVIQRVGYKAPAPPARIAAPKLEFSSEPATAVPEQPFVSHGVVILPDGEPAAISAHQLKERIFRVCGPAANTVGIKFKSPTELDITLHSRSSADAARMARLIMQIPELMTYSVEIRVKLVR
ncbi:MAG: hypothetical protein FJ271_24265 [Planctomycetes bacterium]|nr:hypothetical protein [Planctomycetota bacterium]